MIEMWAYMEDVDWSREARELGGSEEEKDASEDALLLLLRGWLRPNIRQLEAPVSGLKDDVLSLWLEVSGADGLSDCCLPGFAESIRL